VNIVDVGNLNLDGDSSLMPRVMFMAELRSSRITEGNPSKCVLSCFLLI
jgi:hypothetical protein